MFEKLKKFFRNGKNDVSKNNVKKQQKSEDSPNSNSSEMNDDSLGTVAGGQGGQHRPKDL